MAKEPDSAQSGRAVELNKEIDLLLNRGLKTDKPDIDATPSADEDDAMTPRDFIHKRMQELDGKKGKALD